LNNSYIRWLDVLHKLKSALLYLQGAGTDEHTLTRVMVSRCEVDMVQIKQRFSALYGKTLQSFIKVQCMY